MATKTKAQTMKAPDVIRDIESYLTRYMVFTDTEQHAFACALWSAATYLWPSFDAFPYLLITSATKRSGKTRLSELLQFVSSNPRAIAGMTAATIFRIIRDENPSLFIDEAETLSGESASVMRSVLNVGYRRGQVIPRVGKAGVEEWPAYCPKAFVLIGDTYDTLRDRSIIVRLVRGQPKERFLYDAAKADGNALGSRLAEMIAERKADIEEAYAKNPGPSFLPDRDEEIWLPLFAMCQVLCPDRINELERVAVDMATEKTQKAVKHTSLDMDAAEREATDTEYGERLLRDLLSVMVGKYAKNIYTQEALAALMEIPTAPWRKFRGTGLTAIDMGNLLDRFHVHPKVIRRGGSKSKGKTQLARGYSRDNVEKAVAAL